MAFKTCKEKIIGNLKVVYQARWSVNTWDRGLIIKEQLWSYKTGGL